MTLLTRRNWMAAGVAATAAALGVGWRWRQEQSQAGLAVDDAALWALTLPRPGGGELKMAAFKGHPTVVNFWATWCAPCIKELPELDRFHRDYQASGWRVVGLAVDRLEPVQKFLLQTPLAMELGVAGMEGTELAMPLGNTRAVLPFTLVFDAAGHLRQRKIGQTDYAELSGWAKTI